jgi:hypothetical protein
MVSLKANGAFRFMRFRPWRVCVVNVAAVCFKRIITCTDFLSLCEFYRTVSGGRSLCNRWYNATKLLVLRQIGNNTINTQSKSKRIGWAGRVAHMLKGEVHRGFS